MMYRETEQAKARREGKEAAQESLRKVRADRPEWMLTIQDIANLLKGLPYIRDALYVGPQELAIAIAQAKALLEYLEKRGLLIHQPDGEGVCDVCEIERKVERA